MIRDTNQRAGFTIVELLIVIVVIGILAAITIVAYSGIQQRARASMVASTLSQTFQKVAVWQADNSGQYPPTLADAGVVDSNDVSFQYTSSGSGSSGTYCITAMYSTISYYASSLGGVVAEGVCPGHNYVVWDKTKAGATPPVPSAVVDTAVYRTSTASMRIGPNQMGLNIQGNPYSGTTGQTYTVSLWLRTDSNWNGLSNNSKIRFGDTSNGALLQACGYNGVKASWTQVTCSYTLTASTPRVTITVGNDGTTGNIWIDDFSLSRSS